MRIKRICWAVFFLLHIGFSVQAQKSEAEQGAEAAKAVEQAIGLYKHKAETYIDLIGRRLVSSLEDKEYNYHFYIVDMGEPNAFALPGGYVYFSRGILLLANSEEELAGVMGHEIIHVSDHHGRKSKTASIFASLFQVPGAIVGVFAPVAGAILTAPAAVSGALLTSGYSRGNEKSADKEGVALAARSGYDPNGLRTMLDKIFKETERTTEGGGQFSYFSSHPYTPKRVAYVKKTIDKLDYHPSAPFVKSHKEFLEIFRGLCMGENPVQGVFQDGKFLHPDMGFAFAYPEKWETVNSPTRLGFVHPDKTAQMIFDVADTSKTMEEQADKIESGLFKSYNIHPVENGKLKFNGNAAHILRYDIETSNGSPLMLAVVWTSLGDVTYRIAEISKGRMDDAVDLAKSLHKITKKERSTIYQTVLNVVQAREGETLEQLSARTGNVLDIPQLSLINDIDPGTKIPAGRWLKIGVKEVYK